LDEEEEAEAEPTVEGEQSKLSDNGELEAVGGLRLRWTPIVRQPEPLLKV
jgi:hypothetical protein